MSVHTEVLTFYGLIITRTISQEVFRWKFSGLLRELIRCMCVHHAFENTTQKGIHFCGSIINIRYTQYAVRSVIIMN